MPAHQHQPSPIPPVIARELRHEYENVREYCHWTCCGTAGGTVNTGARVAVRAMAAETVAAKARVAETVAETVRAAAMAAARVKAVARAAARARAAASTRTAHAGAGLVVYGACTIDERD